VGFEQPGLDFEGAVANLLHLADLLTVLRIDRRANRCPEQRNWLRHSYASSRCMRTLSSNYAEVRVARRVNDRYEEVNGPDGEHPVAGDRRRYFRSRRNPLGHAGGVRAGLE